MKKVISIGILFSFLSCTQDKPIIHFDNKSVSFGVTVHGKPASALFVVSNKGTADLRISKIITDCRCILASDSIMIVKRNKSDTIKITYLGDTHDIGLTIERNILIEANTDPIYTHLKLTGKVL